MTINRKIFINVLILISLVIPLHSTASPTLILPLDRDEVDMKNYLEILEDHTAKLTIDDILTAKYDSAFTDAAYYPLNIGFTRSAYWVKFTAFNTATRQTPSILLLQFSNINILDFYQISPSGKILKMVKTGNLRPISTRDIISQKPAFTIIVQPNTANTFYLRIKNQSTTNLTMLMTTTDGYLHISRINNFFMGIFIGIMLILIGYNFTLAYSLKDRAYFYFNFSIIFLSLYTFIYKGYAGIYFFGDSPQLNLIFLPITVGLLIFFFMLFTDNFLILKESSPLDHKLVMADAYISLLSIIIYPFFDFQTTIILLDFVVIIGFLTAIFVSYRSWRYKGIIGKYFFISNLFFFVMTLLTLFVIFGFLKSRFIMDNSYIIGNFPAIIALSFALAKRVKIIKQNKEKRERKLEKSIKKFESIIAYNNDIFWETDQHSTFRYVSSNVKNVLGWSDKEMIGKKAFELVTKEEIKRMTAVLSKAAKENKPVLNYEYKMKSKSGEWIILEKNAKPFYSKEGKLEGFRGNDRDITAYYQYKEILRESEEKYKTIIENTNMGILIIDDKYHISYANPRFEKITGYKFKDIENQDFRELLSPDTGKEISINDKMLRQKKKDILNYEIKIVHKNKSLIPVKAYIKAITKISGDSSYIIQIIDISEQKQLEDQLIMSQKMEAIGTLAGGIAHDFNNLLTVIKGYSEVLLTNLDTKDPRLKHVSTILSASEKAEALTKQILAFSRRQIYQTQQLDINRQLSEFLKMAGRIIGEDISIETDFNEEIPLIQADPGQIDQIMINLLINARDAITQNTNSSEKKIMITTQLAAEKDISKFNITNANSGKYVEIMISDTGIGMKDDIKNKIFEPFFTTKDKDSNTGLGLATVYGIIAQNKGFIDVESTINKGTRFKIYWPVNPNKTDWQQ